MRNTIINLLPLVCGLTFGTGIRDFADIQDYAALSTTSRGVRRMMGPELPTGGMYGLITAADEEYTFTGLQKDPLDKVCGFIMQGKYRPLVLPSPPQRIIARAFTEVLTPSMKAMSEKTFELLLEAGGSREPGFLVRIYASLVKKVYEIKDTDTPDEVERKINSNLLSPDFMRLIIGMKIERAINPTGNQFIRGAILDKRIHEIVLNPGLTGPKYKVVGFEQCTKKLICKLLTEWKLEGMSEEDYKKLGDTKRSTRGNYFFDLVDNPDGPGVKLTWEKRVAESDPTQEERHIMEREGYFYIPLAMIRRGRLLKEFYPSKLVLFKEIINLSEMKRVNPLQMVEFLFLLQVPGTDNLVSTSSASS